MRYIQFAGNQQYGNISPVKVQIYTEKVISRFLPKFQFLSIKGW